MSKTSWAVASLTVVALALTTGCSSKPKTEIVFTEPKEIVDQIAITDIAFKDGVVTFKYQNSARPEDEDRRYMFSIEAKTFDNKDLLVDEETERVTQSDLSKEENANGMLVSIKTDTKTRTIKKIVITHKTSSYSSLY
jgi:hypothetical protein